MAGHEGLFDEGSEFRTGDQGADAHIGGFAVYGGSLGDRRAFQDGDPALIDDTKAFLKDVLEGYGDATNPDRSIGRTPFDDLRGEGNS